MLIAKSMLGSASTKRAAVSTSASVARRRSPVTGSETYRQSGPLPVWPAPSRSSSGAVSPPRGRSVHERGALSSARSTSSAGMRTRVPSTAAPAAAQRSRAPASFISTPVRASRVSEASWMRRQASSSQILSVARFTVVPFAWWSFGGDAVGGRRLGALSRAPPAAWAATGAERRRPPASAGPAFAEDLEPEAAEVAAGVGVTEEFVPRCRSVRRGLLRRAAGGSSRWRRCGARAAPPDRVRGRAPRPVHTASRGAVKRDRVGDHEDVGAIDLPDDARDLRSAQDLVEPGPPRLAEDDEAGVPLAREAQDLLTHGVALELDDLALERPGQREDGVQLAAGPRRRGAACARGGPRAGPGVAARGGAPGARA